MNRINEKDSKKIIQKELEESIERGKRYKGIYAEKIEIGSMHNIVTFHSCDYLIQFQCFQHKFLHISFLSLWIPLILFALSFYYPIHLFYIFKYFLPLSVMSQ